MRHVNLNPFSIVLAAGFSVAAGAAAADEGMWTVDNFPVQTVEERYGFEITTDWLERVRLGTVRLSNCTASFVSPEGLMLTNHHCVASCLAQHSSRQASLLESGFLADERPTELRCGTQIADVLVDFEDVTRKVQVATKDLDDKAANEMRKQMLTGLEQRCEEAANRSGRPLKCEAVILYGGGQYFLYKYKRYDDVRLVFAPEAGIAAFGGDPDNFQFPRWALDFALLRAYEQGEPADAPDHLRIDFAGAEPGELVFVSGHPGATDRLLTAAQLKTIRDSELPPTLLRAAELRGRYIEFAKTAAEAALIVQDPLHSLENGLKVRRKLMDALLDDRLIRARKAEEAELRAVVASHEQPHDSVADPWERIEQAQTVARIISLPYAFLEGTAGFNSRLFRYARVLVRGAAERQKPNVDRLREYTDAALPRIEQNLRAKVPLYPDLERLTLSFSLERMREWLGPDHPLVHRLLAEDSPDSLAESLVSGSKLGDLDARIALWDGGEAAIEASDDPMIRLARSVDADARAIRQRYEDEVEAPVDVAAEQIADVRFAAYGTGNYPDATFTLRISYGTVRGWIENGTPVEPVTHLRRLLERATGYPPFAIPMSWLAVEDELQPGTPFNLATDNDIVGGNSGSPLIDTDGEIVGLIFDGNIHSIAGSFWFDEEKNRAVAVHPAIILEALTKVYRADALLDELADVN